MGETAITMPAACKLIAGPARSGKTHRLLQRYRNQLTCAQTESFASGECCWLAPNQTAALQLQAGLLSSAKAAFLRPNVSTFAQFADGLITRSDSRIRAISRPQKQRLLQQAVQTVRDQGRLEHFARVASTPGFVLQVDEFIADLKRKDIWAETLQGRPGLGRRARELADIYAAYQQILHRGELYDAEGRFWAAREILTKKFSAGRQRFDLIVVNGFNDFTESQYDILRLLSECSSQLLISLTVELAGSGTTGESDGETLAFAKTEGTFSRLREMMPQLEIESLKAASAAENSLRELQQQLFREPRPRRETAEPISGVEILAANSAFSEAEAIGVQVKSLLCSGRAQPEDIVIVCPAGESVAELIATVLPDFGIPFYSEIRRHLEAEPLVRTLAALIRLHQEDWPFQTLLEVIGNGLLTRFDAQFDPESSFATRPRVALEQSVRSAQLISGRHALLEQLEYRSSLTPAGATDERAVQVAIALAELRQLDQALAALPAEATLDEWTQAIEGLLSQLGALSAVDSPDSSSNGPLAHDTRAERAWKLLQRGLRSVVQVEGWSLATPPDLNLSELQELIATTTRGQRMPPKTDAEGRVRILSAESARKLSVKHLFLVGLNEQAFSNSPSSDQSPSSDDPQTLLAELSAVETEPIDPEPELAPLLGPSLGPMLGDGMLLFYELVSRATESLTLSYPALDGKGQPLPPSPLLTELERSVGEGRIHRRVQTLGASVSSDAAAFSAASFRRQAVEQALDGKQRWLAGMISQPNFVRTGSSILSGIDCVAQRGTREGFGPHEGLILSEDAKAALAQRFNEQHLWSPSQLESYATCPFRFFSEYLLGLEPLSELTVSNDARRRGSLLHQVLATIHQQLADVESNELASEGEAVELVRRFLAALNAAVQATPLRGIEQSLREIERREIEAWAPDYAEQETKYRKQWQHLDEPPTPTCFEVRFGPETRSSADETPDQRSTPIPFELDLGEERIRLTGQIDRVDVGRVGGVTVFNIIDYKSGKEVKLKLDKVRDGRQLQLPLYALAAEQLLLAEEEAVALATGYWNIRGKGFESARGGALHLRELTDQSLQATHDWQQLQPDILVRVQELIGGIRGGDFPVFNQDEHCTNSCSLSTVCRVAQVRSLEKAWPADEEPESRSSDSNTTE